MSQNQEPDSWPRLQTYFALEFEILALTGLHIGGQESSIAIGGKENVIVRDPLTSRPYIPGSSLKGKMRSLVEQHGEDIEQNWPIARGRVQIHACKERAAYAQCSLCQLFGIPAPSSERWFCQTRLRVSDTFLSTESEARLRLADTDLPYTEVKSEAAIDRVTAAAVPRTVERVPAGAAFGPARMGLFFYEGDDRDQMLNLLLQGMELVEADYLGGGGSRGSGRVAFRQIGLARQDFDGQGERVVAGPFESLAEFLESLNEIHQAMV